MSRWTPRRPRPCAGRRWRSARPLTASTRRGRCTAWTTCPSPCGPRSSHRTPATRRCSRRSRSACANCSAEADPGPSEGDVMQEQFTDRARQVMQLANQEAQRFQHEYVGTEHILLGLVKEGSGVAANVLLNLDVDLAKVRREVEKIVQSGPETSAMGKLPQTPRAKKVIEYATEEARLARHQ